MNHKQLLLSLLVSLFVLTTACKTAEPEAEPTDQATSADAAITMTPTQMEMAGIVLGQPEKRIISSHIDCTGRVEVPPQSLASVYAPVAGFIQFVRHLPGDFVRKGALLTSIRHPELIRMQREFLQIKNQLPFLEQEYQRKKTLAESDVASVKALQQAQTELNVARIQLKGLKAELDLIGLSTDKLEAEEEIQATLPIYAPVSGYITNVEINLGKLVSPSDLLFEIIDQQHLHLELQVFAKDINQVRKGQRIVCSVPGSPHTYSANVHLVGRKIDAETRTAMVHGHFTEEPVSVTAGVYVQGRIFTTGEEALTVPNEAIVQSGGTSFVFVKHPEGFEKRAVRTGRTDEMYTEVFDLTGNETIAIAGAYYINGSEPVE